MRIGVVDYDAGNLTSVETALDRIGADFFVSRDPDVLLKADKLIFPGVGRAEHAMANLENFGIAPMIREFFSTGKDILGICIGSQILLESSEEGNTPCIGMVEGKAKRFPETPGFKVPHMGWNQVKHSQSHRIFKGIPENSSFYFVHTYYPEPSHKDQIYSYTEYMIPFPSSLGRDNLVATQFHPEKSGEVGLKLIDNFIREKN